MVKKAKKELIDTGKDAIMAKSAEYICNNYSEEFFFKARATDNIKISPKDFDFTGISNIVGECEKD